MQRILDRNEQKEKNNDMLKISGVHSRKQSQVSNISSFIGGMQAVVGDRHTSTDHRVLNTVNSQVVHTSENEQSIKTVQNILKQQHENQSKRQAQIDLKMDDSQPHKNSNELKKSNEQIQQQQNLEPGKGEEPKQAHMDNSDLIEAI